MKTFRVLIAATICACATTSFAQAPAPAQAAKPTDLYHVLFAKAAPGQAAALAKELQEPDPKDPMTSHFILLRHQEGADWDYCLIQHLGAKASVEIPAAAKPSASLAWHDDSFVSGPSWAEFQKVMGLGEQAGQPVYVVSVQRAVPGHRDQLLQLLNQRPANAKVTVSSLVMTHVEGGPWQFLTLDRYNSWQDLGTDRATNTGGQGWTDTRQHSAYHTDTIADRVR